VDSFDEFCMPPSRRYVHAGETEQNAQILEARGDFSILNQRPSEFFPFGLDHTARECGSFVPGLMVFSDLHTDLFTSGANDKVGTLLIPNLASKADDLEIEINDRALPHLFLVYPRHS
jgi:hypothetical protein